MDIIISLFEIVFLWTFSLVRGWMYYRINCFEISISNFIARCFSLDIDVLSAFFNFKFIKQHFIYNVLTVMEIIVILFFLIINIFY